MRFATQITAGMICLILTFAAPVPTGTAAETKSGGTSWTNSYADAKAYAAANHKLILADFTGSDWCPYCAQLQHEVFNKQAFKDWSPNHVALLELDFPQRKRLPANIKQQNDRLRQKFGVNVFPTVIVLDANGKEIDRISGYGGAAKWMARIKQIVAKAEG